MLALLAASLIAFMVIPMLLHIDRESDRLIKQANLSSSNSSRPDGEFVPPASSPSNTSPTKASPQDGSGKYADYEFTYKKSGDQVVALFMSPMLPRNDSIVVSAARAVIESGYQEKTSGSPRLVTWSVQGKAVNAIKLLGERHSFVVVPIKEDTGEIHTLSIWSTVKD